MKKTHADKIREAVTDLGIASPNEIMAWIKRHYPDSEINPDSYRADITGCSVNHTSSHHYPGMPKFLWFENGTKKYRLAKSDEMLNVKRSKKRTTPQSANGSTYINGIAIAKLSVTGQVVIPSKIRDTMGFQTGDTLAFIINEKGILEIRKARLRLDLT